MPAISLLYVGHRFGLFEANGNLWKLLDDSGDESINKARVTSVSFANF